MLAQSASRGINFGGTSGRCSGGTWLTDFPYTVCGNPECRQGLASV